MTPDLKLDPPEWMRDEATVKLMCVLNTKDDESQSLFVGGCVRNWILQKPVQDIDIATKFIPNEVMSLLGAEGIKVIPTGIDHGTVTAVVDGKPFEITTLRRDDDTDGRRAKISYTDSWEEDAGRRDFTMNTLLADSEGHIYDPLGEGISDAKAGRVLFVGEPSKRIEEDYLRILRFFRFHAFYGQGEMDSDALGACRDSAENISSLSRERITQEFLKIISVSDASEILKIIFDYKVLHDLPDKNYQSDVLQNLCYLQVKYKAVKIESRLFVLAGNKASLFEQYMRLSHAQKKFIIKLEMLTDKKFYTDEKALKKAIFYYGNELLLQGYLLSLAREGSHGALEMIDVLTNWTAPKCPITGDALIAEGFVTGPDLGQELKRRQEEWLEDNL